MALSTLPQRAVAVLSEYRASPAEKIRAESLLNLIGSGESVLEIGARDGYYTRLLAQRFRRVVALDIMPFYVPGAECVVGDVRSLKFAANEFEAVLCAEVLEHIPEVQQAAGELVRVARHRLIVGLPYRQDLRLSKYTCGSCGAIRPAWGHVHSFDERRFRSLFPGLRADIDFVGLGRPATNAISSWLMDRAGNPYGDYSEPCHACGSEIRPPRRGLVSKACSRAAVTLDRIQSPFTPQREGAWIHGVFRK